MITLVAREKKNMRTQEVKWYAQISRVKPVTLDEISERIASNCTVTEHDIKAVLSALQEQVVFCMKEGQSVRLGDLGSFRPTVSSSGFATKDKVSADGVTKINVRFTKGSRLRSLLRKGQKGVKLALEGDVLEEETQAGEQA